MPDPYALPDDRDDAVTTPGRPPEGARPATRPALMWLVLVVALVLNALASIAGAPVLVQDGTGVVALVCGVEIVARHVRRRPAK